MQISSLVLGQIGANTYFVKDTKANELFLVDPGAEPQKIIDTVTDMKAKLQYIIITHAHFDHIEATDEVKNHFNSPIVIHEADAPALNDPNINLCALFNGSTPISKPDIIVHDLDILPFGESHLTFYHTPGHTRGSMCIGIENYLFSGDTILKSSVGRTDFPGGSFEAIQSSIKEKIYTLRPQTIIYPGHGISTTVDYEKNFNPFVRG